MDREFVFRTAVEPDGFSTNAPRVETPLEFASASPPPAAPDVAPIVSGPSSPASAEASALVSRFADEPLGFPRPPEPQEAPAPGLVARLLDHPEQQPASAATPPSLPLAGRRDPTIGRSAEPQRGAGAADSQVSQPNPPHVAAIQPSSSLTRPTANAPLVYRSVDAASINREAEGERGAAAPASVSTASSSPPDHASTSLFQAFRHAALGDAVSASAAFDGASPAAGSPVFGGDAEMPLQRSAEATGPVHLDDSQPGAPAWVMPELPLAGIPRTTGTASMLTSATGGLQRSASPGTLAADLPFVAAAAGAAAPQAAIQREPEAHHEAIARVVDEPTTSGSPTTSDSKAPEKLDLSQLDIDELSERVWSRIRRKLRIERERSRGIV